MHELRGTGVAIVTPFNNYAIDYDALARCIAYVIEGGVDYIVALGSTGESATQSPAERRAVLDFTIREVSGDVPIVAGNFGGNDTRRICQLMDSYDFEGITAVLSSSPEYNKPTQEGIFRHYEYLANHCPRPIIVYNVPGRTASNITVDTAIRLAGISGICGIKEASGDMLQGKRIVQGTDNSFLVLSGDDPTALGLMRLGGDGVISVIANAVPQQFSAMTRLALGEKWEAAASLDQALAELHPLLYKEGNPAGIKGALRHLGIAGDEVRLPLVGLSDETRNSIGQHLQRIMASTPSPDPSKP